MQSIRLLSTFAAVALIFVIGSDAAAQPQQGQQGQQAQQAEIERLRRELDQARQQQGQPLLVVPSLQQAPPVPRVDPDLQMAELAPLLERVERASGKRFLVDRRLGSRIYLGTVDANDVTYPVLLSILSLNGWAAFESEGLVKVVPDANIRFYETRIVQTDDDSIPADEFITRVLATTNVGAAQLIPILRPLMSQAGHMAAHSDTNQIILMDRYANIQRITAIVRTLDVPPRNRE
jgi:type II secretory pathway component GspD/PulD (secretin)